MSLIKECRICYNQLTKEEEKNFKDMCLKCDKRFNSL